MAVSLADVNALVSAHDRLDAAKERVFGVGIPNIVRVPSGTALARIEACTHQPIEKRQDGGMELSYRGIRFVLPPRRKEGEA